MRDADQNDEYQDQEDFPDGHLIDESGDGESKRRRTRVKIRKRVRIKRKSSPKKKLKKILEAIAWVLVIAAFIATIIVLVVELDFNSKNRKKRSLHIDVKNQGGQLIASLSGDEPNFTSIVYNYHS